MTKTTVFKKTVRRFARFHDKLAVS